MDYRNDIVVQKNITRHFVEHKTEIMQPVLQVQ